MCQCISASQRVIACSRTSLITHTEADTGWDSRSTQVRQVASEALTHFANTTKVSLHWQTTIRWKPLTKLTLAFQEMHALP